MVSPFVAIMIRLPTIRSVSSRQSERLSKACRKVSSTARSMRDNSPKTFQDQPRPAKTSQGQPRTALLRNQQDVYDLRASAVHILMPSPGDPEKLMMVNSSPPRTVSSEPPSSTLATKGRNDMSLCTSLLAWNDGTDFRMCPAPRRVIAR